jgi:hypothetical protein
MTSKNIFLSEEGLRRLIKESNANSLNESSSEFGRDILWTISKKVELPVVLDENGEASNQPLTLIGAFT